MFTALIVEDHAALRQALKGLLNHKFPLMAVEEAVNGKEALEKVEALRPPLIFMDIRLPGENGLELTKKIKTDHAKTVIVMLTNHNLPEYREAAKKYGASFLLSKGFWTEAEIFTLVEVVLSYLGFDKKGNDLRKPVDDFWQKLVGKEELHATANL